MSGGRGNNSLSEGQLELLQKNLIIGAVLDFKSRLLIESIQGFPSPREALRMAGLASPFHIVS